MKHFKLTSETKVNFLGKTLFRIELITDCKWGKIGDKGGFLEKEENLSGNAWVFGNAEVFGNARVFGDARVTKKVFILNFCYNLTLTDNHIKFGCEMRTIQEWEKWLKSDQIINTPRTDKKFKLIEMSLNLAIEQWKQLNN